MLDFLNIFPFYLILIAIILVIIPTIIAIILRCSLYSYLIDSANKVSRLSLNESRGKQPAIVNKLEARFRQASKRLEQVNTIALIDGLYSQERLKFFGISLRCEQWNYFCQALPNLLLSFGLLGTFIGISSNLYNLSQTINFEQNVADVNDLITQLQQPLQNMGIAFSTSLVAIFCSSVLIVVNLRCNTNFAKFLLISSLEDYLDNIYKIKIGGYSRLDEAVDSMVKQQEDFFNRLLPKVGQVLETTIGNAANKMVAANQGFQNNVDSMVSRFNDISSSMATTTDRFQSSTFSLKEQIETVTTIVPEFATAANKIKSGSNLYLQGAEKIEASKFSENLEQLTADLANTQKLFSVTTDSLKNHVEQLIVNNRETANIAKEVYTEFKQASVTIKEASSMIDRGSVNFTHAAETLQKTDFADKLMTATKELTNIPQQFNDSTSILHQSTNALSTAIDRINSSTEETNNLIEQVSNLNRHSSKLLEINAEQTQQELKSFENIQSELNQIVLSLVKHKEQMNESLESFGGKLLDSFEQQTNSYNNRLEKLTKQLEQYFDYLERSQNQLSEVLETIIERESNVISESNSLETLNNQISLLTDKQIIEDIHHLYTIRQELVKIASLIEINTKAKCNFKMCK